MTCHDDNAATTAISPRVVAVVVTYNRRALLEITLSRLLGEKLVALIIVVNNGSTDGTREYLDMLSTERVTVVHQQNVGGSGGFERGMREAMETSPDYIWCMDDDVFPCEGCLGKLLEAFSDSAVGIACPRRVMRDDGSLFVTECRGLDLKNPFGSLHTGKLSREIVTAPVDIAGMVFEGPLVARRVVEKVGLPKGGLFIFYDDTDFSYRAVLAGFRVLYVPDAVMEKERFFNNDTWEQRQLKKRWKRLYQVRNGAWFNHRYGKNWTVRYMRQWLTLVGYLGSETLLLMRGKSSVSNISSLYRAWRDGVRERLGKIE